MMKPDFRHAPEKELFFNKRIELGYARQKGLEEGIEKGIEKGTLNTQIAIAKKLKHLGISDKQIAQTTSLDASTIQALEV